MHGQIRDTVQRCVCNARSVQPGDHIGRGLLAKGIIHNRIDLDPVCIAVGIVAKARISGIFGTAQNLITNLKNDQKPINIYYYYYSYY